MCMCHFWTQCKLDLLAPRRYTQSFPKGNKELRSKVLGGSSTQSRCSHHQPDRLYGWCKVGTDFAIARKLQPSRADTKLPKTSIARASNKLWQLSNPVEQEQGTDQHQIGVIEVGHNSVNPEPTQRKITTEEGVGRGKTFFWLLHHKQDSVGFWTCMVSFYHSHLMDKETKGVK